MGLGPLVDLLVEGTHRAPSLLPLVKLSSELVLFFLKMLCFFFPNFLTEQKNLQGCGDFV